MSQPLEQDPLAGMNNAPEGAMPEGQTPPEPAIIGSELLAALVKGGPMTMGEAELSGTDLQFGMKEVDGQILFDGATVSMNEKRIIGNLLAKQADSQEMPEWFSQMYGAETDEFRATLLDHLKTRLGSLEQGQTWEEWLDTISSNKKNSMRLAAGEFREMARREQIKKTVDAQVKMLPFFFFGQDGEGMLHQLKLDDLDYIYTIDEQGDAVLNVASRNPAYMSVFMASPEQGAMRNKFGRTVESENSVMANGKNLDFYEVMVDEGDTGIQPIFSKIRVFKEPVDLEAELQSYDRAVTQRRKKKYASNPPASNYGGNYGEGSSFVSSSGSR